jgi:hypothetical protein
MLRPSRSRTARPEHREESTATPHPAQTRPGQRPPRRTKSPRALICSSLRRPAVPGEEREPGHPAVRRRPGQEITISVCGFWVAGLAVVVTACYGARPALPRHAHARLAEFHTMVVRPRPGRPLRGTRRHAPRRQHRHHPATATYRDDAPSTGPTTGRAPRHTPPRRRTQRPTYVRRRHDVCRAVARGCRRRRAPGRTARLDRPDAVSAWCSPGCETLA